MTGWSDDRDDVGAFGMSRRERQPVWEAPRPLPEHPKAMPLQKAIEWFAGRGISEATLDRARVTADNEFCPVCDKEVGRVLFPYFVQGEHVNTKHRCGKKHFTMEKGAKRVFYNYDVALKGMAQHDNTLIICEGEMDALSIMEAGYDNVVSVPDGAPSVDAKNYAAKFSFLSDGEDLIDSAHHVILATDSDGPGHKLLNELARRIGPEKCKRVIWDNGIKDANECLIEAGADYLAMCIETAESFPVEGIFTGLELQTDLLNLYDHGNDPGTGFGFTSLDSLYRVKTGQVSFVTGIPNHGKSAVMDVLFMQKADREDWRFAIFSPEQQPLTLHQRNLIEIHTGKPFSEGPSDRMTREEMLEANRWVAERFAFILPEEPDIDTILSLAKVQVYRNGIKGVVIDPWNELESSRPHHQTQTEYIGDSLRKIKKFARDYDVHVWIIAHPTKLPRPKEPGAAEPIPGLWDISDSAHWRNKADIGVTVYRDLRYKERNEVYVIMTKMRWQPDQGDIGAVKFGYNRVNKRLTEIGVVDMQEELGR